MIYQTAPVAYDVRSGILATELAYLIKQFFFKPNYLCFHLWLQSDREKVLIDRSQSWLENKCIRCTQGCLPNIEQVPYLACGQQSTQWRLEVLSSSTELGPPFC